MIEYVQSRIENDLSTLEPHEGLMTRLARITPGKVDDELDLFVS